MQCTAPRDALSGLIQNLRRQGFTVVGPSLSDGVVRLAEVGDLGDLASGILDVQGPGTYTVSFGSPLVFLSVNGPDSPKEYLHPSGVELLKLAEKSDGVDVVSVFHSNKKYAFVGIRPCDLRGVEVMDRTMMVPGFEDPIYSSLRRGAVFVVANCTRAGNNCFCTSMGSGPVADQGYDLAITELPEKLLLDIPEESSSLLEGIETTPATEEDLRMAREMVRHTREQMAKRIERENPSELMREQTDSPVWKTTAERCLACGNCTMVCPTCFCNVTEDRTDIKDGSVSRVRLWDSCLTKEFTYSAGGNPRQERIARYRQFVMHKFAYWPEQFGVYGCVGCGRCITWCPVGIDITETVNGILRGRSAGTEGKEALQVV
jgi:ferredoxin